MISKIFLKFTPLILLITLTLHPGKLSSQPVQDFNSVIELPDILDIQASPTHLYVLSGTEGMAVFRSYPDSLQWLYTSSGMQRRGSEIQADIRFAYLYGNNRRFTVLEPTSVLGVYSSTTLPSRPLRAGRIDNTLFILMENGQLGSLSLDTPETVDSPIRMAEANDFKNSGLTDLAASNISKRLFVLNNNGALHVMTYLDGSLQTENTLDLGENITNLIEAGEDLYASTVNGRLFRVTSAGLSPGLGSFDEPVTFVHRLEDLLILRTRSGRVWYRDASGRFHEWKSDPEAGNYLTANDKKIWIAENNKLSAILNGSVTADSVAARPENAPFSVAEVPDQVLTYPSPLLLALNATGASPSQTEFSVRSDLNNITVRGNGLRWQPNANQLGLHWITVIGSTSDGKSDSTRFSVDVRSFNAPPRFGPVRNVTIAVGEEYQLQITAVDPEAPQSKLIRYLGVDMPEGAVINERTGLFTWNPSERQTGETTFRVIATDKLGAANSIDITLNVKDISRGDS